MDEKTKQKQDKIIEMTTSFCHDKLNDEYADLASKLVEKMGRKHDVPFKRGKSEIWASSVIYVLAQVNFLFDKSVEFHISADDICDYFGTKKSTVSNKARTIYDMFNSHQFDEEISAKGNDSQFDLEDDDIEILGIDSDRFFDNVYQLYANGEADKALTMLDLIKEDNPEYGHALFYKSIILSSLGDKNAEDVFKQSLISELGNDASIKNEDVGEELNFLTGLIESANDDFDFNDAEGLFKQGFLAYNLGDFEEALDLFDLSLDLDSNQTEALYYKSLTLACIGNFREAVRVIDKAIAIDSKDDRFWNEKGNYLASMHNFKKANKCFDRAIKLNPNDPVIWANKGFMYKESKKYKKALAAYNKACEIDSEDVHSIIGKYNVYMEMDNKSKAKKCLDEASKIDDEDLEYLTAMVEFLWAQFKLEEALKYCDKCLKIDDENVLIWIYKAMINIGLDNDAEADYCLEKALEIDPFIMEVFDELANELNL